MLIRLSFRSDLRNLPPPPRRLDDTLAACPDFVFNTLIGTSAYTFYRLFHEACVARRIDQPCQIPIASGSLSEPELEEIGPRAASAAPFSLRVIRDRSGNKPAAGALAIVMA